jgi:putative hydrolase of the HAD superfamily
VIRYDYYFFRYFDGGIISADIKISKPDIRIYKYFFSKYALKPDECLYIDDVEENVLAAASTGMQVFLTYGSTKISDELEEKLKTRMGN